MANHNNFGKDMEALFESYSKVEGQIPSTANTAMPRMLNEAHCDEEHEGGEETVKVELELELDKETAKKLHDQLMDEVVEEEPAEGELPAEDSSCNAGDEEHAEDGEHEDGEHAESPFPAADHDAPEGGLGSRSMDEAEDGEGDVKKEVLAAIKDGAGEFAHKNAGLATSAQELAAQYEEAGDEERASIANNLAQYFNTQSKFDEDAEEVVAESYTAQYLLK